MNFVGNRTKDLKVGQAHGRDAENRLMVIDSCEYDESTNLTRVTYHYMTPDEFHNLSEQ